MKEVVRTEAAPAPFQGAPYSQAIKANGFVFVAGQVALKPGGHEITGETIQEQTEQALANLGAILEAAGSGFDRLVKTTVFLQHLDDFQGMNEVYATTRGRPAARPLDRRGRQAPIGRARRDRGNRPDLAVDRTIEDFVRGLGLDAYLVGGAVRDELLGLESKDADFVVPGVDYDGLRAALEPHGRVEDLEVAGRRVGARLYPTDRRVRDLAPAGIEFAPPRAERSTGPGPPRLRDRRRPGDLDRGRHGPARLHRERDGEAA